MRYQEIHKNIFTVSDDYYLAHCIASDLRMGAGIAVPMQKKFALRGKILSTGKSVHFPTCVLTGSVFNLITKNKSSGKPTYDTLQKSLECMKEIAQKESVKKIAMPKIGCGLDRLQWEVVRNMIQNLFSDVDVEILVCVWN